MKIQRRRRFISFVLQYTVTSILFLVLIVLVLPTLSGAQQACQPDGDVDQNGNVTAADALLAFQQALDLVQLDACQLTIANVFPSPPMPDGSITASDALCIFQKALGLPSCLDSVPSSNEPPSAQAGMDQSVDAGTVVTLSGMASDPDGTITSYLWEQTRGTMVTLRGADGATVTFTAPDVSADETLTFRLTVTDNGGAASRDDVSITVKASPEPDIDVTQYLTGPVEQGEAPALFAAVVDEEGVRAVGAAGVRRLGSPEKVTVNDLIHIGSNTKAMTATMLAVLVEDGVFPHGWETTIADIFPELVGEIHQDYHDVDLFQLVRMTGGIPRNATDWGAHQDEPAITERRYVILRDNLAEPPAGQTGEFLYSNLGYMVAGAMAERLTGESWEVLMEEYLFAPLGMTTAGFGPPGTPGAVDQPWGHYRNEMGVWTPVQSDNPEAVGPAGTVHISIADWAKFISLWFPGRAPAILDRASLDELIVTDSEHYAAGWNVGPREWADGRVIFHDGSNGIWRTVLWIAPNRGIAYLAAANASDIFGNDAIFWVLDGIVGRLINETLGSGQ